MTRDKALEELRSRLLVAVQGGDWVKTKWDIGELWMELGSLTSPLRAALSSPCAICGGEELAAEIAAWMDADIHASLSALATPFRLPESGAVYLYGEDSRVGNHRKHVRILVFDDLPGEEP